MRFAKLLAVTVACKAARLTVGLAFVDVEVLDVVLAATNDAAARFALVLFASHPRSLAPPGAIAVEVDFAHYDCLPHSQSMNRVNAPGCGSAASRSRSTSAIGSPPAIRTRTTSRSVA